MSIIRQADLSKWAQTIGARDALGELLRRLVHASTDLSAIETIRFLAHEANQLSGWDGILDCQSKAPWIPAGTSVWELGAGYNTREKIRGDFKKRLKQELPLEWGRDHTTYVAVTLRKLDDITALENELKKTSPWLDVKVIDAQSFEEWIEITQTVELWLQEKGIGPPSSVHTLIRNWQYWSEKTRPPVSTKLVLAGRIQNAKVLLDSLVRPSNPINIQADSSEEALAFVYSAVELSNKPLFRDNFFARSL